MNKILIPILSNLSSYTFYRKRFTYSVTGTTAFDSGKQVMVTKFINHPHGYRTQYFYKTIPKISHNRFRDL